MARTAKSTKGRTDLEKAAAKLLAEAKKNGLASNYYFVSTFERYQVQLKILKDLEAAIQEYGATVTKEYVKGRENLTANPAITEYNRTATAANGTVSTLLNILKTAPKEPETTDALAEFIK